MRNMLANEGVRSFYKGLSAGLLRQATHIDCSSWILQPLPPPDGPRLQHYGMFATRGCDRFVNVWDDINKRILYQVFFFAVLVAAFFNDLIKTAVGRPRLDFWRCFHDEKQLYDQVTRDVLCHGEKNFLQDGRKSFPSGHTSCNFALEWHGSKYFTAMCTVMTDDNIKLVVARRE
ncbi:putative lipid phosphate phosphatase 3, chloroplastic [Zea mays]|uniref:Putative lipid phosphate phosphatase 3, chloroplastic n=1 Tax=Zea mays TaxID=4577 RepID=A0A3L6G579_MAIZE|nr:putative lipid phosphate phosphatase 3, chloroplastic [Zea mays]